ncbi:substrate-binding domain-containing protein, partial [Bifidobacterium pseudocatenulatum]|nr:substrate-binding domain-containing protein [Bifidobacterium pseudocatenulatum]
ADLGVAASQGIKVPEEISLMSWDDSLMCTAAYPHLPAMGRDVVDTRKQAAGLLRKLHCGERVGHHMEG